MENKKLDLDSQVFTDDLGAVLNCAVRYCIGRRTYMPKLVMDVIRPLLPALTEKTLWCFEWDIEGADNYGADYDEEEWMRFLSEVKAEIARRNDMLTGNEIKLQVAAGRIVIQPFDEENIGPNSYDVHLSDELLAYTEAVLDPRQDNRYRTVKIPPEGLVLLPGRVYLGKTMEYTESPYHIPMYEGRSSLGRLGVFSHVSAGFGDVGFKGTWTLELVVAQPVRIYPGLRVGQLYWHNPDGEILRRYEGKYQGQTNATPSRLFQDREWEEETR